MMLTFACGLNEFESFIIMFCNKMNTIWYLFVCARARCILGGGEAAWEKQEGNSHKL